MNTIGKPCSMTIHKPLKRSRTRAFLLTLASGQAHSLITMIVGFLATPILLQHLGTERFGIWRVLEVWIAYLGLIPQCIGQAVGFLILPLLTGTDDDRLRRFVATAAVTSAIVAMLAALAGSVLAPALPSIAAVPTGLEAETRQAFLIVIWTTVPLAPFLLLRSAFEADQRGYLVNAILGVTTLLATGLAVLLATSGAGLAGQAVAIAAGVIFQALLFGLLALHLYPWIRRPSRPDWANLRGIIQRSLTLVLLAVLGGVAARIEYQFVIFFEGPVETANYSLGQRLFLVYGGLVAAVGNSIWAPLADLYHRGESVCLREQLGRAIRFVAVAGTAGAITLLATTPSFLRLWVGDGFDPGPLARLGFAVTYPLLGINILLTWVLSATAHNRAMLAGTTTYFVVTLTAGVILGWYHGAGGVAWGTAAGVMSAVVVNLVACRAAFRLPAGRLATELLIIAALAVLHGTGLAELIARLPQLGWLEFFLVLGLGWAGFFVPAVFVVLSREDRLELRARLFKH